MERVSRGSESFQIGDFVFLPANVGGFYFAGRVVGHDEGTKLLVDVFGVKPEIKVEAAKLKGFLQYLETIIIDITAKPEDPPFGVLDSYLLAWRQYNREGGPFRYLSQEMRTEMEVRCSPTPDANSLEAIRAFHLMAMAGRQAAQAARTHLAAHNPGWGPTPSSMNSNNPRQHAEQDSESSSATFLEEAQNAVEGAVEAAESAEGTEQAEKEMEEGKKEAVVSGHDQNSPWVVEDAVTSDHDEPKGAAALKEEEKEVAKTENIKPTMKTKRKIQEKPEGPSDSKPKLPEKKLKMDRGTTLVKKDKSEKGNKKENVEQDEPKVEGPKDKSKARATSKRNPETKPSTAEEPPVPAKRTRRK